MLDSESVVKAPNCVIPFAPGPAYRPSSARTRLVEAGLGDARPDERAGVRDIGEHGAGRVDQQGRVLGIAVDPRDQTIQPSQVDDRDERADGLSGDAVQNGQRDGEPRTIDRSRDQKAADDRLV
jgi:hypothetical protein